MREETFILKQDQPVLSQPQYRVCKSGEYNAGDLVEVYMDTDSTKFPIAAFHAEYIATGKNPGENIGTLDNTGLQV